MNRNMKTPTACVDGGEHDWRIARQRGNKVRHECSKCLHMDPWKKSETATVTHKADGANVQHKAEQESVAPMTVGTDFNDWLVADLRDLAKQRGVTGYSKMRKVDLVAALEKGEAVAS